MTGRIVINFQKSAVFIFVLWRYLKQCYFTQFAEPKAVYSPLCTAKKHKMFVPVLWEMKLDTEDEYMREFISQYMERVMN